MRSLILGGDLDQRTLRGAAALYHAAGRVIATGAASVTTHEQVEHINTREDLVAFIEQLRLDYENHPEGWGNGDLAEFLDGLAGWTDDMAGYLENRGLDPEEMPVWRLFGMMLMAAAAYE